MRGEIRALRREVAALRKDLQALQKSPAPAQPTPADAPQPTTAEVRNSRPTAESVKRLRKRLGVSQKDFARLLGVTPLTVYLWERQTGRLNLRSKAKTALYNARSLTKRAAAERLAALPPA
jgi:DNA-binding transcriptional regulator YiaG